MIQVLRYPTSIVNNLSDIVNVSYNHETYTEEEENIGQLLLTKVRSL